MAQQKFSSPSISNEVRQDLNGGCMAFGKTFDKMPSGWINDPTEVAMKCGVDGVVHDTVFFKDTSKSGVIIILNETGNQINGDLFKELYDILP